MLTRILEKCGRKRVLFDQDESDPYLERYYLLFRDRPNWFPFSALLHHFCRSDHDTFHDHPWHWASLVLRGGYWENTPEGRFWRGAGSFRFRRATSLHFIELDRQKAKSETWTLFFIGPKIRDWGFSVDGRWVQWKKHLDLKQKVNS